MYILAKKILRGVHRTNFAVTKASGVLLTFSDTPTVEVKPPSAAEIKRTLRRIMFLLGFLLISASIRNFIINLSSLHLYICIESLGTDNR